VGSLPVPPVHFLGHLGCRRHDAGQPPGGPKEFSSSVLELLNLFFWMIFENKFKPFIGQLFRNSWLSFVIMLHNMASESLNGL